MNKTYLSCECQYKFNDRRCNSTKVRIKIKVDDDCKNPRKHHECEKIYISNPCRSNCEHGKYSESIMSALVVCVIKLQGPQNLFQKTFFHKNCSNKNC